MQDSRPAALVTGSSGLIGRPVCLALESRGFDVYAFDVVPPPDDGHSPQHLYPVEFDATDQASVDAATDQIRQRGGERLATAVHLAAYYDFSGEESELYDEVTVNGTDRLLRSLQPFRLDQFVFSSTMLVHAPCEPGEHLNEEGELLAKWPYPESKVRTEAIIRDRYPEVRSVLLRIAGVYNDWGKQPTLVQQIKRIYERDFQSYFFPGNPRAGQAFVYVDDVVEAILNTVSSRERIPAHTPILIGEPDPPSYEQLQDLIGEAIHGKEWWTIRVPKPLARVGAAATESVSREEQFIKPFMIQLADDHYALDISRAKELIDWQPKHRLLDMLPTIIGHLKESPREWYQRNGLDGKEAS